MLQDIRDNSQGLIAKVIIGLMVAVFAMWGVESIIGGFIAPPSVATVNGEQINEQQLAINTQNLLNSLGGNLESLDQGLLEQIALNQLIEEQLLQQAVAKNNMNVSEDRIDRAILETSAFQINGLFDSNLALRTMASQGYSVPLYRDQLRNSMLLSQLTNTYTSSNFVTEAELEQIAELRLQSRDFRYISIPIGTRTLGQAISDEEIATYYQANPQEFTIEESVRVAYVLLDKLVLMEELEISEELIIEQYNRERSAFDASTERRASHILFEVGTSLSQEQAEAQAVAAKQRLDSGEDFAALALELSSDAVSAEEGGDIGFSAGTAFPSAIEAALDTLTVGQVSGPVTTEFGVHLIMLTENNENQYPPLEELRERIERELRGSDTELMFAERLESLSNMAFESSDLNAISEQLNLTVMQSEPIARSGGIGLFSSPRVIEAVFSDDVINNGHNSDAIELNDAQAMVLRMLEHTPATVRPLEEVQGEIAVILRTEMERVRAAALGEEILQAMRNGESVEELVTVNELEWLAEQAATRSSGAVNPQLINAVFAMQKPDSGDNPVYQGLSLTNGTYVVIELQKVNPGDLSVLASAEREAMISQMLDEKAQADFNSFIANLREEADITTNLVTDESF
ncbi:MAG: SurA N-terminal domain-containing protein [Pseudohongiellaceae bacterium]